LVYPRIGFTLLCKQLMFYWFDTADDFADQACETKMKKIH